MGRAVVVVIFAGALAAGAYYVAKHWPRPAPVAPTPVTKPIPEPPPPAPVDAAPQKPTVSHRVPVGPQHEVPPVDQSDPYVGRALRGLLGSKAVTSFLNLDGFARRFVATVSNLSGESASPERWPVRQTPGRFEADARDDHFVIGARNAARYAPFVAFVEGVDSKKAVATYVAMYPLLQRAYGDLGDPVPYFNDRVVAVIDNLLATPEVAEVRVKHLAADGAAPSAGAARLYVYEDPALERASAGQKILLRSGPDNARRLKAKLAEIRALLVSNPVRQ
jgi:hypothetical protein